MTNETPGLAELAPRLITRRRLIVAILAIAAIGLLVWFFMSRTMVANDFSIYWRAANEPVANAYLPREHSPFPYPPTMLLWVQPLSWLPLWPAYAGWVGLSVLAFVAASRPFLDSRALLLALLCPEMIRCLATGQVSAALAGLLIYAFTTPHRGRAGLALAIVASIKPQYVVMAPLYLAVTRDWRAMAWAAGGFVALIGASLLAFGIFAWASWVDAFPMFHDVLIRDNVLSVSITPASQAEYWGFAPLPFLLAGSAVGAWLVTQTKADDAVSAAAIVGGGSLLAAPYALAYDLLPVIPFLARETIRRSVAAGAAILIGFGPLPLPLTIFALRRGARRASGGNVPDPTNPEKI